MSKLDKVKKKMKVGVVSPGLTEETCVVTLEL